MADLATELVQITRRRPPAGRLTNALQHLWGYVNEFEETAGASPARDPGVLVAKVRELVVRHSVTYLLHSTALSNLDAWIALPDPGADRTRIGGDR